jgi:CspA family cold shock protein
MRALGTVRWYNDAQGCGYISPSDGSRDCFVRSQSIRGFQTLAEGEQVEFDVVHERHGPGASDVAPHRATRGGR